RLRARPGGPDRALSAVVVHCPAARGSAALADASSLAAQVAQVVELGAADVTADVHLDLLDDGRVHREGALDAHAEADLADREGLADPAALAADDDALEHLDTRAAALDDAHVDGHGVTRAELRHVGLHRLLVDEIKLLHDVSPDHSP